MKVGGTVETAKERNSCEDRKKHSDFTTSSGKFFNAQILENHCRAAHPQQETVQSCESRCSISLQKVNIHIT